MHSENAKFLRQGLVEKYRKMTPAQRLKAFVEHSRLMQGLRAAGALHRRTRKDRTREGRSGHG